MCQIYPRTFVFFLSKQSTMFYLDVRSWTASQKNYGTRNHKPNNTLVSLVQIRIYDTLFLDDNSTHICCTISIWIENMSDVFTINSTIYKCWLQSCARLVVVDWWQMSLSYRSYISPINISCWKYCKCIRNIKTLTPQEKLCKLSNGFLNSFPYTSTCFKLDECLIKITSVHHVNSNYSSLH